MWIWGRDTMQLIAEFFPPKQIPCLKSFYGPPMLLGYSPITLTFKILHHLSLPTPSYTTVSHTLVNWPSLPSRMCCMLSCLRASASDTPLCLYWLDLLLLLLQGPFSNSLGSSWSGSGALPRYSHCTLCFHLPHCLLFSVIPIKLEALRKRYYLFC